MCNQAVDNFADALEYVPACFKTPEMCDKAFSKDPFMLKYHLDRYKTHEMWDKAVIIFYQH